jgi:hypothetical protein
MNGGSGSRAPWPGGTASVSPDSGGTGATATVVTAKFLNLSSRTATTGTSIRHRLPTCHHLQYGQGYVFSRSSSLTPDDRFNARKWALAAPSERHFCFRQHRGRNTPSRRAISPSFMSSLHGNQLQLFLTGLRCESPPFGKRDRSSTCQTCSPTHRATAHPTIDP